MSETHFFDAGQMGCSDGFAAEFRRRMEQIEIGDVLVATVRDPSAKTDIPPLARMMGHDLLGLDERPDGALVFRVARGR
ncbi:MAG: sulfurtransferase TusA family protein [Actinomycetota bacterium]